MKRLFRKIDSSLSTAKIIVKVCLALIALLIVVLSILAFVNGSVLVGFIYLIVGAFSIFIAYMFWNLLFAFLVDVKLIRNKLYGESSSEIALVDYGISITETKEKDNNQN